MILERKPATGVQPESFVAFGFSMVLLAIAVQADIGEGWHFAVVGAVILIVGLSGYWCWPKADPTGRFKRRANTALAIDCLVFFFAFNAGAEGSQNGIMYFAAMSLCAVAYVAFSTCDQRSRLRNSDASKSA